LFIKNIHLRGRGTYLADFPFVLFFNKHPCPAIVKSKRDLDYICVYNINKSWVIKDLQLNGHGGPAKVNSHPSDIVLPFKNSPQFRCIKEDTSIQSRNSPV
jgi:hypothetical protein